MMPSFPIGSIGASAGGVEALEQFFKSLPAGNGLAFRRRNRSNALLLIGDREISGAGCRAP
jgi:hypothetical protein